jgi:hypothetical protein
LAEKNQPTLDYGRSPEAYAQTGVIPPDPGNLLFALFTKPRDAFVWLMGIKPTYLVLPIVIVDGASGWLYDVFDLMGSSLKSSDLAMSLAGYFAFTVTISVILFYLLSMACRSVGRLLGGTGDARRVRCALAWASVPSIPFEFSIMPVLIFLAMSADESLVFVAEILSMTLLSAVVCCTIWLMSIGLGVAHRFSSFRGLATTLTGIAIVAGPAGAVIFGLSVWQ